MTESGTRHPFSLDEWHQLGALFDEDARVELLEGDVLDMAPIGSRHARAVTRLNRLLYALVGDRAVVSIQNPVVVSERTELQPDVALLIPPLERYTAHPRPSDVYLLIEVADTSLAYDRDRKAPLYGAAGVPETWVIDLAGGAVIVLSEPDAASPRGYRQERRAGRGETLAVGALPGLTVDVDEVLGPA